MTRIYIDEGDNADWTKKTWDLPDVRTWEDVRRATGMTKAEFKTTPTYRLAAKYGTLPPDLRK